MKHLRLATLALVAPLLMATAACSADKPVPQVAALQPSGDQTPLAKKDDSLLPYVKCMRDKGLDIDDKGEFPKNPDGSMDMPRDFGPAHEACQSLMPEAPLAGVNPEDEKAANIKLATCMRDNGVTDWPDPLAPGQTPKANGKGGMVSSSGGGFDLPDSVDLSSPSVKKALDKCMGGAGMGVSTGSGAVVK